MDNITAINGTLNLIKDLSATPKDIHIRCKFLAVKLSCVEWHKLQHFANVVRARKSADYQNENISTADYFPFGDVSYRQMIYLKVARLKAVMYLDRPKNESLWDTILDMINYADMYLEAKL